MRTIKVKDLSIGQMPPKICIPLMGEDYEQLLKSTRDSLNAGADLYEIRGDFFNNPNKQEVLKSLEDIRKLTKDQPLIFTLRSEKEGGVKTVSEKEYINLNLAVIESGLVDIIDVEVSRGKDVINRLSEAAGAKKKIIMLSKHFFQGGLQKEEIVRYFLEMQAFPSGIHKIAVMADTEEDLLELLGASLIMRDKLASCPFVAIAMGYKGILSRVGGGLFGSAITFAKAEEASAPGQLKASEVRSIMDIIHR